MAGVWGTVQHGGFKNAAAKVVCRQLGYIDGCKIIIVLTIIIYEK